MCIRDRLDPDVLIILGDRYDIYPIAIVGQIIQKPIIHIHGGEITHGCIDDSIRHSITKGMVIIQKRIR